MAIVYYTRKIKSIQYNWHVSYDGNEVFSSFTAGEDDCEGITYHEPRGGADKHYCDVFFEDKSLIRCFNINKIIYDPPEVKDD